MENTQITRNIRLVLITTFCISLAMAMNGALYNNFLKLLLKSEYLKMGEVESIREVPGIMSVFINGVVGHLPEPLLGAVALIIMGLGFVGYYWTTAAPSLITMSFIWSIGFHFWVPVSGSIGMSLAPKNKLGSIMGKIASIGALGTIIGYLLIVISAWAMAGYMKYFYRWMYLAAGLAILVGAYTIYKIYWEHPEIPKIRLLARKKYLLYYILQFLEGCRKQVFITFASFTLVLIYNTGPELMAILLLLNYIVAFFVSPIFGRWIDKYGEKKILTINYLLLIAVYLVYATVHNRWILYNLYCIDNVLYTFSMALSTYIGKIAPREEVTATLAMGVSINHVAAVIVPIVGFLIWQNMGYELCFIAGGGMVLLQLIAVQWMKHEGI